MDIIQETKHQKIRSSLNIDNIWYIIPTDVTNYILSIILSEDPFTNIKSVCRIFKDSYEHIRKKFLTKETLKRFLTNRKILSNIYTKLVLLLFQQLSTIINSNRGSNFVTKHRFELGIIKSGNHSISSTYYKRSGFLDITFFPDNNLYKLNEMEFKYQKIDDNNFGEFGKYLTEELSATAEKKLSLIIDEQKLDEKLNNFFYTTKEIKQISILPGFGHEPHAKKKYTLPKLIHNIINRLIIKYPYQGACISLPFENFGRMWDNQQFLNDLKAMYKTYILNDKIDCENELITKGIF